MPRRRFVDIRYVCTGSIGRINKCPHVGGSQGFELKAAATTNAARMTDACVNKTPIMIAILTSYGWPLRTNAVRCALVGFNA